MIRAVLFDFGGVLSRTGRQGFITEMIAELYGVKPSEIDTSAWHGDVRRNRGDEDALFKTLNKRFGRNVTKQMFIDAVSKRVELVPEVFELARTLRDHGIKTAIFSNVFAMNARELKKHGAYDGFDPVLLSYEAGCAKPDVAFYELAVQKLDLPPEEILLIDDQDKCLSPAKAMGMHVLKAVDPAQIVSDARAIFRRENNITL